MQRLFILSAIFLLSISAENCAKKQKNNTIYKGRLEIKAICMNYTIQLLEGNMDTSKITTSWINETTKKSYSNVFGLENPCKFPASIKEGEEFYFVIDTLSSEPCMVCTAYYPTPEKKLFIKIVEKQ